MNVALIYSQVESSNPNSAYCNQIQSHLLFVFVVFILILVPDKDKEVEPTVAPITLVADNVDTTTPPEVVDSIIDNEPEPTVPVEETRASCKPWSLPYCLWLLLILKVPVLVLVRAVEHEVVAMLVVNCNSCRLIVRNYFKLPNNIIYCRPFKPNWARRL